MKSPLQNLSAEGLLSRTKSLLEEERRATLALIEHLEEISRRRLYAEWGFASMWEFCIRELGMSEGAAQRRLQAMKLVRDVPEAKTALANGKLSLSNAAKVQGFRQAQKKQGGPVSDAAELLKQVECLSQRECEAKLYEISPQALPQERDRVVSASNEHELRIVVSAELHEKLSRIKGLLAHARPDASYADLLEHMANETLARLERKKGIVSCEAPSAVTTTAASDMQNAQEEQERRIQEAITAAAIVSERRPLPAGLRVALPAAVIRAAFARSKGRCEFLAKKGRRCCSKFRLEVDHFVPLALGGTNELANLRVLCQVHNAQQAEEKLGRGHSREQCAARAQ